jgi:hypothetical protein
LGETIQTETILFLTPLHQRAVVEAVEVELLEMVGLEAGRRILARREQVTLQALHRLKEQTAGLQAFPAQIMGLEEGAGPL